MISSCQFFLETKYHGSEWIVWTKALMVKSIFCLNTFVWTTQQLHSIQNVNRSTHNARSPFITFSQISRISRTITSPKFIALILFIRTNPTQITNLSTTNRYEWYLWSILIFPNKYLLSNHNNCSIYLVRFRKNFWKNLMKLVSTQLTTE